MSAMVKHPNRYFGQWIPARTQLLMALEEKAEQQGIPIVGPVVGKLLYLLANIKGAQHIAELGTATGYSTIFMGNACQLNHGRLTTFGADSEMAARAICNIEQAGLDQWVRVRCEDAHAFNRAIFEDAEWESVNLWTVLPGHSPGNDGLCIALKRS